MKADGRIQTLTNLGLTVDQARIYLALLQGGPATARQIANASKIARPDIYRIIPSIEKQGMVERLMTKPVSYRAVPPAIVLPNIIERKTTEQKLLIRDTEELLDDLRCIETGICGSEDGSVMVYGKDGIVQRLKMAIVKARSTVCIVTSRERFSGAILEFSGGYRYALKQGVTVKITVEQHALSKATSKTTHSLARNSNFEVKYLSSPQPAVVTIIDGKEAFVTMSTSAQSSDATALWSKNPSLIALAQNYFDNVWNHAAP